MVSLRKTTWRKKKEEKKDAEWLLMHYFKNGIGVIKGNTVPRVH